MTQFRTLLAILLVFAVTACSEDSDNTPAHDQEQTNPDPSNPQDKTDPDPSNPQDPPKTEDACPNSTIKTEPGICGCDVPDTDTDNDKTPDCNDKCPNDSNKTEPGNCGCGFVDSDEDSDGDGVKDCTDACPLDATKKDSAGTCGCGTPEVDQDNDSFPDCIDICPFIPTSYNVEATDEFLRQIDEKAEKLRQEILNAKDELDLSSMKNIYYVANAGSDDNDGKSPEKPFKTIGAANKVAKDGDAILFNRGDLFRGKWRPKEGLTYAAYGTGEKPKIYGSPENGAFADNWELEDETNHIWRYKNKFTGDVGGLIFNDGEATAIKEIPDWDIPNKRFVLQSDSSVAFDYHKELDEDLEFFFDGQDALSDDGFPVSSSITGYIHLRSDAGNPGTRFKTIEFNTFGHTIDVAKIKRVTIDNLAVRFSGSHGIAGGEHADSLHITNCEVGWIGGVIHKYWIDSGNKKLAKTTRYGNAIQIYGALDDFIVKHNWLYQSYDTGLTHQRGNIGDGDYSMTNVEYAYNLIENNTWNIEYYNSGLTEKSPSIMKDVDIHDNIARFAGFGWGRIRRADTGGAAAVKSWKADNPAKNFVFHDNIFDRSTSQLIQAISNKRYAPDSIPKFVNNIYIQDINGIWGMVGTDTTNLNYTCNLIPQMADKSSPFFDETGKIYFTNNTKISEHLGCPNEKISAYPESCLCEPDIDIDKDGINNCKDYCPAVATSYDMVASDTETASYETQIDERRAQILEAKDELDFTGKTVYYIAPDGSDKNDGLSPDSPFATIKNAHKACNNASCAFLLKRDNTYDFSIEPMSNCFYGAYGTGTKPLLSTGENVSDKNMWSEVDTVNHIWKLDHDVSDVSLILFNDSVVTKRKLAIWDVTKKKFVNDDGSDFAPEKILKDNMQFVSVADSKLTDKEKDGVKVQIPNVKHALGGLYLKYANGNPAEFYHSVHLVKGSTAGISIAENAENIIIDNIAIKYNGGSTINIAGNTKNITIQNCEIAWNGGIISKYDIDGSASISVYNIQSGTAFKNLSFKNNYFHDNYARNLQLGYGKADNNVTIDNLHLDGNLFEHNYQDVNIGIISIPDGSSVAYSNASISDNIFARTGEGWGGTINGCGNECAPIVMYKGDNPFSNSVIENNLFYRSRNHMIYAYQTKTDADLPKLSSNTFVKEYGSSFGSYMLDEDMLYDCTLAGKILKSNLKYSDKNAIIKFIP